MNQARRPNRTQHRARPNVAAKRDDENVANDDEYYRMDYINFINRLMQRMEMDKVKEMFDRAMELTR